MRGILGSFTGLGFYKRYHKNTKWFVGFGGFRASGLVGL